MSLAQLTRLRETRDAAFSTAEGVRNKYKGGNANMTDSEYEEFTRACDDAEKAQQEYNDLDKQLRTERSFDKLDNLRGWEGTSNTPAPVIRHSDGGSTSAKAQEKNMADYKQLRNRYLRGIVSKHDFESEAMRIRPELRAYQADNPAGGGFAIPLEELSDTILTLMKDNVWMRQISHNETLVTSASLGVPAIDTDPSDSDWTSELAMGSEESTLALGKRELKPSPVAKYIKMSRKLVRQKPDIESTILGRLTYKMGITEEKAFLTGNGANQPLGVFTASTNGISTSRDVAAASSTVIAADDIVNTLYKLKFQYQAQSSFVMHRDVVKAVRKLKDSNNNYIWTIGGGGEGTVSGPGGGLAKATPTQLLGRNLYSSEYAPNTFTTGLYMMLVGNFEYYWIATALDMQLDIATELYIATNQYGYFLRSEVDGMPVFEEAFARLALA